MRKTIFLGAFAILLNGCADSGDFGQVDASIMIGAELRDAALADAGGCFFAEGYLAKAAIVADVLNTMTNEDYETNWFPVFDTSTERRELFTPAPHNSVAVFQNAMSRDALVAWEEGGFVLPLSMPDRSIIVKNNFDDTSEVDAVTSRTIMVKDVDLDPVVYPNQWFWFKTNSEYKVIESCAVVPASYVAGNVAGCTNCHNGRANQGTWPEGGKENAVVAYDYIIAAYCRDPATTECTTGL